MENILGHIIDLAVKKNIYKMKLCGITTALLLVMMTSNEGMCVAPLVEFECLTSCTGGTSVGVTSSPGACCRRGRGYRMLGLAGESSDCQPCWDSQLLQPLDLDGGENETDSLTGSGDDDECSGDGAECNEHATCQTIGGTLKCVCNQGFTGNESSCVDVDECTEGTATCDGRHYLIVTSHHQVFFRTRGLCSNTAGSFLCSCRKGFVQEGSKCIDIDECQSGERVCAPNAMCHNHVGSYHCHCQKGYVGDGKQCCVSWYELWQYIDREGGHDVSGSQDKTSRGSRSRGRQTSKNKSSYSHGRTRLRLSGKRSRSKKSSDNSLSQSSSSSLQLTKGCEHFLRTQFKQ